MPESISKKTVAPYLIIITAALVVIGIIVGLLLHKGNNRTAGNDAATMPKDQKTASEIILNSIADGVLMLDETQTIRTFNPAAEGITGWKQDEATGLKYSAVLRLQNEKGEAYQANADPFVRAFAEKSVVSDHDAYLKTHTDGTISLDITVSPLLDEENEAYGAVAVFRDVSERRRQEAQRADFVSTASHEMRTPIAAIEGYLALAMNDRVVNIDAKARSYLEKAHDSTKHLGQLFQDLLTSTKAEDGRLANHPAVIEMAEYLTNLTDTFKFTAQKKGLNIEFIIGAEGSVVDTTNTNMIKPLYYVHADPERIREVITNLFDNAVKYTENGKITLGLTGDKDVVQVRVQDTGAGIPAEDIPHLFQKFYRVDNSSTRTIGGTGLGLFICRKIIEMYQGRIWVESRVGAGSTFFINLPRLPSDQAAALQRQEAAQQVRLTNTPLPPGL